MKYLLPACGAILLLSTLFSCSGGTGEEPKGRNVGNGATPTGSAFITVSGMDLLLPSGEKFFIRGTNLSNWLNPEGYLMDLGGSANSAHSIDMMLRELVGPSKTDKFWREFKDNYITRDDIEFLSERGVNTLRLPLNYRLFTDEDYMGETSGGDIYQRIDRLLTWCTAEGIYLILDMHSAPGGQTGYNIDDSYGYPWLFLEEEDQDELVSIWKDIASHYADETHILGYELLNEPVADYWPEHTVLNAELEPLYKRITSAIREVDGNHIVILGAPQWNLNFSVFSDWKFDPLLMYTCHKYDGEPTLENIRDFVDFRDKTGLPMYMGEIGHNPDYWQEEFCKLLEEQNIGYTFWPYKKIGGECFVSVKAPSGWDSVKKFADSDRSSYFGIYSSRPDQNSSLSILDEYISNIKFANCSVNEGYISSLRLSR
ncbi:MAG: cellulase family glycosylhydrolase [Bacteroidales bacterium]|nr:cellulase family glycosylhydrolase [Bacteroidales bacterium]